MDLRRLPLLLLVLVLLPVPARADRHFWECFTGLTTEKEALAARVSCGLRLVATEAPTDDSTPQGITGSRSWTGRLRATNTGLEPEDGDGGARPPTARSLFLVAEAAEYVLGNDSGEALDGWMVGLRYFMFGPRDVEPFFHVMGGRQRPSRGNAAEAATDWSHLAAIGGGVDIELTSRNVGIVPVMRLQFDLLDSGATAGIHPYGRGTFGVSFRFEGHAHK